MSKYKNTYKNTNRVVVESITSWSSVEEGLVRGIASEFQDYVDMLASLSDMVSLGKENIIPKVRLVTDKLKRTLSKITIQYPRNDSHWLLKFRQSLANWRFYFFLNHEEFKRCLNVVKTTGKDPVGNVNISFNKRIIPELYAAKNSYDLIKLVDLYVKRLELVRQLQIQYPQNSGYNPFLRQGLYGLRDLVIAVRRVASYTSV